jgi:hypothetical protein
MGFGLFTCYYHKACNISLSVFEHVSINNRSLISSMKSASAQAFAEVFFAQSPPVWEAYVHSKNSLNLRNQFNMKQ